MVLDDKLEFADATALSTAATGRAIVGDVVDTTVARNLAAGNGQLFLVIQVTTAVTSAGSATVSFEVVSDAQAALATDGTATMHWKSPDIPKATLIAGYTAAMIPIPQDFPAYERYFGVLQNVGTAALTAGAVNAFLTTAAGRWKAYPDAL